MVVLNCSKLFFATVSGILKHFSCKTARKLFGLKIKLIGAPEKFGHKEGNRSGSGKVRLFKYKINHIYFEKNRNKKNTFRWHFCSKLLVPDRWWDLYRSEMHPPWPGDQPPFPGPSWNIESGSECKMKLCQKLQKPRSKNYSLITYGGLPMG